MGVASLLLVEGAQGTDKSFEPALTKAGYNVMVVDTGAHAVNWARENAPDLVIFDASSMRSSGTRSCRRLREALGDTPIIHCRAAGELRDSKAQADMYLEQPFTARKLINRVRALLPADDMKEEIVRCGPLTIYLSKRVVDVVGKGEQRLTPKLARLLEEFCRHVNETISRKHLMQEVWNTDYVGDTRTLDVHIRWVRETIEETPGRPRLVRTVRGTGYVFSPKA